MKIFAFNGDIAEDVGVEAAVMFQSILFWIEKNAVEKRNYHDGDYWTYNSVAAWSRLFPFWGPDKVRRLTEQLRDKEYLKTGNYNESRYDKTLWYALGELGKRYSQICQSDSDEVPSRFGKSAEPIPVNIPVDNTIGITPEFRDPELPKRANQDTRKILRRETTQSVIEYLNKKTGRKFNYKAHMGLIGALISLGFTADDMKLVVDKKCEEWLNDPKMSAYLRPETLFQKGKFDTYLNTPVSKRDEQPAWMSRQMSLVDDQIPDLWEQGDDT